MQDISNQVLRSERGGVSESNGHLTVAGGPVVTLGTHATTDQNVVYCVKTGEKGKSRVPIEKQSMLCHLPPGLDVLGAVSLGKPRDGARGVHVLLQFPHCPRLRC